MEENFVTLRGKRFSRQDIELVEQCITNHYSQGRTFISRKICESLNWNQANGWLKDRACRDVMLQLERKGIIKLPPPLVIRGGIDDKPKLVTKPSSLLDDYDVVTEINTLSADIKLSFAKSDKQEKIWNELVGKYHYLGHRVVVGRCIKYLIYSESKLLGAISFSSPAWHLDDRDVLLNDLDIGNEEIGDQVINNNRFLILPNVKVKNLASRILSLATKQIYSDWITYYSLTPLIVETFCQPSLYPGTCYRAANWHEVGTSKGYAKRGRSYHNSQEPKTLFLYGLTKPVRHRLEQVIRARQLLRPEQ